MFPRPDLSFTLPSIHDNTRLDCRVYHPPYHSEPMGTSQRHAAVVAHPYAPLGGSYDDPIVCLLAKTLLDVGFVVATFNFRYALRLTRLSTENILYRRAYITFGL